MKNIDILKTIKEKLCEVNFSMDDIQVILDTEDTDINNLILSSNPKVINTIETIGEINLHLNSLTEDLRGSMFNEGFECDSYDTWYKSLQYNPASLDGLMETFDDVHKILECYINETIRGYRILTQEGYVSDK